MKEEILKRIAEFDAKSLMVKNIILHQARAQQETNELHVAILRAAGHGRANVVGVVGDIAVVETSDFERAPFKAVMLKDGKWTRCGSCWPNPAQAFLDGIGTLAEGCNSRFASYAWRMIADCKGEG